MFSNKNVWSDNTLPTLWFSQGFRCFQVSSQLRRVTPPRGHAPCLSGATPPKTNAGGPKMTPYLKPELHFQNHQPFGIYVRFQRGNMEFPWKLMVARWNKSEKKNKVPFSEGYVGFRGWVFLYTLQGTNISYHIAAWEEEIHQLKNTLTSHICFGSTPHTGFQSTPGWHYIFLVTGIPT